MSIQTISTSCPICNERIEIPPRESSEKMVTYLGCNHTSHKICKEVWQSRREGCYVCYISEQRLDVKKILSLASQVEKEIVRRRKNEKIQRVAHKAFASYTYPPTTKPLSAFTFTVLSGERLDPGS